MSKDKELYDKYAVVVCGPGGCGKSCITNRYISQVFTDEYDPTIEDYYSKEISIDGKEGVIEILDTAGQEEYSYMRDRYMRSGQGFICVYSITDRNSFEDVKKYKKKLWIIKDTDESQKIPFILVGNKLDLADQQRKVSKEEGEEFAKSFGAVFFESSAKDDINVDIIFESIVREIRKDRDAKGYKLEKTQKPGEDMRRKLIEKFSRWGFKEKTKQMVNKVVGGLKKAFSHSSDKSSSSNSSAGSNSSSNGTSSAGNVNSVSLPSFSQPELSQQPQPKQTASSWAKQDDSEDKAELQRSMEEETASMKVDDRIISDLDDILSDLETFGFDQTNSVKASPVPVKIVSSQSQPQQQQQQRQQQRQQPQQQSQSQPPQQQQQQQPQQQQQRQQPQQQQQRQPQQQQQQQQRQPQQQQQQQQRQPQQQSQQTTTTTRIPLKMSSKQPPRAANALMAQPEPQSLSSSSSDNSNNNGGGSAPGGNYSTIPAANRGRKIEDFIQVPWYYAQMSSDEAHELLISEPNGTFLARSSSQANCIAISYKDSDGIPQKGLVAYDLSIPSFWMVADPDTKASSLVDLVELLHVSLQRPLIMHR